MPATFISVLATCFWILHPLIQSEMPQVWSTWIPADHSYAWRACPNPQGFQDSENFRGHLIKLLQIKQFILKNKTKILCYFLDLIV